MLTLFRTSRLVGLAGPPHGLRTDLKTQVPFLGPLGREQAIPQALGDQKTRGYLLATEKRAPNVTERRCPEAPSQRAPAPSYREVWPPHIPPHFPRVREGCSVIHWRSLSLGLSCDGRPPAPSEIPQLLPLFCFVPAAPPPFGILACSSLIPSSLELLLWKGQVGEGGRGSCSALRAMPPTLHPNPKVSLESFT